MRPLVASKHPAAGGYGEGDLNLDILGRTLDSPSALTSKPNLDLRQRHGRSPTCKEVAETLHGAPGL